MFRRLKVFKKQNKLVYVFLLFYFFFFLVLFMLVFIFFKRFSGFFAWLLLDPRKFKKYVMFKLPKAYEKRWRVAKYRTPHPYKPKRARAKLRNSHRTMIPHQFPLPKPVIVYVGRKKILLFKRIFSISMFNFIEIFCIFFLFCQWFLFKSFYFLSLSVVFMLFCGVGAFYFYWFVLCFIYCFKFDWISVQFKLNVFLYIQICKNIKFFLKLCSLVDRIMIRW